MFPDKLPVCFISFARPFDVNRPSVLSEAVLQRPSTYRKKGLQGLTVVFVYRIELLDDPALTFGEIITYNI